MVLIASEALSCIVICALTGRRMSALVCTPMVEKDHIKSHILQCLKCVFCLLFFASFRNSNSLFSFSRICASLTLRWLGTYLYKTKCWRWRLWIKQWMALKWKEQDFAQDFKRLTVLTAIMMNISVVSKIITQIKAPLLKAIQIYKVREYWQAKTRSEVIWVSLF